MQCHACRLRCCLVNRKGGAAAAAAKSGAAQRTKSSKTVSKASTEVPRFVMLSSAAVTRPAWSKEEKEEFSAAVEVSAQIRFGVVHVVVQFYVPGERCVVLTTYDLQHRLDMLLLQYAV